MSNEKPYVKWYGRDWLGDPLLRMVGVAERGVWIDLLSAMMLAEPYGHLAIAGRAMTDEEAARLTGLDLDTYKGYLYRLIEVGIPSKTTEGMIYSRRLVREYQLFMSGKTYGKKGGGNPALRVDPPVSPTPPSEKNPESIVQNPEAKGGIKVPYIGPPNAEPVRKSFKTWTEAEFLAEVHAANADGTLIPSEVTDFVAYWQEASPTGRTRLQMERTWDTHRRMLTAVRMVYSKQRQDSGREPRPKYDPWAAHVKQESDHATE
jgi:hypothetical protein